MQKTTQSISSLKLNMSPQSTTSFRGSSDKWHNDWVTKDGSGMAKNGSVPLAALQVAYQAPGTTLQALAEREHFTFAVLYSAFNAASIPIRKPDQYWYEHTVSGESLKAIAAAHKVSPSAVSHALREHGYTPQRSTSKQTTGESAGRGYVLSQRLRDAVNRLGEAALMRGIAYFEAHPDQLVLENIGVGEKHAYREFTSLSQTDVDRIRVLADSKGSRWGSVVVRNALDYLIKTEGLTDLAKPANWQAKPLALVHGGQNPNQKLTEPESYRAVSLPLSVWRRIEHLQVPRGKSKPGRLDLSGFIRLAIDQAEAETLRAYRPETPPQTKRFRTSRSFSVRLYDRQIELVNTLQTKLGWSFSATIAAIITQACDSKLVPAAKVKPALRLTAQQRQVWQSFRKTKSLELTAHALGLSEEAATKTLIDTGLVEPIRPRTAPDALK